VGGGRRTVVLVSAVILMVVSVATGDAIGSRGTGTHTALCYDASGYRCTPGYAGQPWSHEAAGQCVAYVAWRLAQDGIAGFAGQVYRWGDAADWAGSAAAAGFAVDAIPELGAVAQWYSNDGPNRCSPPDPPGTYCGGHVGIVVAYLPGAYIDVVSANLPMGGSSEYRITVGDTWWPDNFLHVRGSPRPG
jgi:surface antigen